MKGASPTAPCHLLVRTAALERSERLPRAGFPRPRAQAASPDLHSNPFTTILGGFCDGCAQLEQPERGRARVLGVAVVTVGSQQAPLHPVGERWGWESGSGVAVAPTGHHPHPHAWASALASLHLPTWTWGLWVRQDT